MSLRQLKQVLLCRRRASSQELIQSIEEYAPESRRMVQGEAHSLRPPDAYARKS